MSTEVAPGVYQRRLAHAKALYLAESNLLVDTGPKSAREELLDFLADLGPVDKLFVTHGDGDHVGNVEPVIEEFDPEVLVPENEPLDHVDFRDADVTTVADGEDIAAGVTVVEVPGHTEGICALYLPEKGTLLASDTLDGADRRGLPEGYLLPPPAAFTWDSGAAELNLEKFLTLEFETAVVTHGTNVEEAARQKLDEYLNFKDHYRRKLLEERS